MQLLKKNQHKILNNIAYQLLKPATSLNVAGFLLLFIPGLNGDFAQYFYSTIHFTFF